MKRSPLRRRTPLTPGRALARRPRPRMSPVELDMRDAWHLATVQRARRFDGQARCAVTGWNLLDALEHGEKLEAHHPVDRQTLRRHFPSGHDGLSLAELRWHPANGLLVTTHVHERHTRGLERIPFSTLAPETLDFAGWLGLGDWLNRRYG